VPVERGSAVTSAGKAEVLVVALLTASHSRSTGLALAPTAAADGSKEPGTGEERRARGGACCAHVDATVSGERLRACLLPSALRPLPSALCPPPSR
jgi:hypothetical protein